MFQLCFLFILEVYINEITISKIIFSEYHLFIVLIRGDVGFITNNYGTQTDVQKIL